MPRRRNFLTSLLQSKIFLVLLFIVAVMSLMQLSNEIARRTKISRQISELRAQTDKMRAEQGVLSSLIDYLSSDAYIEEAARTKLNYARPGESLFIITGNESAKRTGDEAASSANSNIRLWWKYFFDAK